MEEIQTEPIETVGNAEILEQLTLLNDNVNLLLEYILRLNAYNLMILAILIVITFFIGMKAGK